jgi:hypothetical protein
MQYARTNIFPLLKINPFIIIRYKISRHHIINISLRGTYGLSGAQSCKLQVRRHGHTACVHGMAARHIHTHTHYVCEFVRERRRRPPDSTARANSIQYSIYLVPLCLCGASRRASQRLPVRLPSGATFRRLALRGYALSVAFFVLTSRLVSSPPYSLLLPEWLVVLQSTRHGRKNPRLRQHHARAQLL